MPHHLRLLGVIVLVIALGFAGSARAQSFSDVVVFGDSLSDSGNAAAASGLPLPPGTSFTTNPDPVWAEIVAETFGASGANSLAGGSNYAVAGACMNPATPCQLADSPTVTEQIDQHLLKSGGSLDPNALYAVWGGLNDIADSAEDNPDTALGHVLAAAGVNAAQIDRLREAGARHVVVFNMPDASLAPFAAVQGPVVQRGLRQLIDQYNEKLYAGIRESEGGVVPINIHAALTALSANPERYGLTNIFETACRAPISEGPVSIRCGPEGSLFPVTYAPGTEETYLFADHSHPTGVIHEMLASMVTSTLAAPLQVSLAGEAGVEAAEAHHGVISAERASDFAQPEGSWRGYAQGRFGGSEAGALARLGEAESEMTALTLGVGHRAGPDLAWGAALSVARHENELGGATLDGDAALVSLHGAWRSGGLQVSAAMTLGQTSVDLARPVRLAEFTRTERGSTEAAQFGGEFEVACSYNTSGTLRHGPFVGLSLLNQEVKGFAENGSSSTALNYSDFSRNSLVLRGGYAFGWSLGSLRPYARIAYERELEDGPIMVSAGSNTMPGRFTLAGFTPSASAVSADLGLSAKFGERASGLVGYAGRFGDGSRSSHRLSLALRVAF